MANRNISIFCQLEIFAIETAKMYEENNKEIKCTAVVM